MATRFVRNNRFLAILLAIDGGLNGIYFGDVLFVVPFAIAALQFYTTPPTWKLRRWLVLFTIVVIVLSLQGSLTQFLGGFSNADPVEIFKGVTLLLVNGLILLNFALTRGSGEVAPSLK